MLNRKCITPFLLIMCWVLLSRAGVAAADLAQRSKLLTDNYTSALMVATALPGDAWNMLATGCAVNLDDLPGSAREQLKSAAALAIDPKIVGDWTESVSQSSGKVGFWLGAEFSLTITDPAMGNLVSVIVPVSELIPSLNARPVADTKCNAPAQDLSTPPSLASALTGVPVEDQARIPWLRLRAFDLLSGLGQAWLTRAGAPFGIADFIQEKDIPLRSLSPAQSAWVQTMYEKHRAIIIAKQELLRKTRAASPASNSNVVSDATTGLVADPSSVPSGVMPKWSSLTGAVKLKVAYLPTLVAITPGAKHVDYMGWSLR